MIKKIIFGFTAILSSFAVAQDGTSSPYSFYGLGESKQENTIENRSMGGVNIFKDSIRINLNNPASYSHLKFTTFTIAGTENINQLNSNGIDSKAYRTSIDYLAVAIPLGKIGVTFGLKNAFTTGYKIQNTNVDVNDEFNLDRYYIGKGGINKFFIGTGYEINKNFSIGFDFNYYFGSKQSDFYEIINQTNYLPGTLELNKANITGYNFNIGLMYQRKIFNEIDFFAGVTYTPKGKLNIENKRNLFSIVYGGAVDAYQITDNLEEENSDLDVKLPSKYTASIGFGNTKKWGVGLEYSSSDNTVFKELHKNDTKVNFENSNKLSLGGFFIPKFNSFTSYLSRVTYRGGFRYENTGIVINNTSIKDSGITFGLGLPIAGIFSNANLGIEFGKRGTNSNGLTKENYTNISLSLSLSDRWFIKRKYN